MKYKIEWENTEAPDLPEDQQRQLEKDIEYITEEIKSADDLMFHTVFLTTDTDGPIVTLYGKEGNKDTLFLVYDKNPVWLSGKDLL